ncbi:hypothetical protein BDQ17DRAFT_1549786 [Cyathus striatus]|nr:hypothetical protein BDQ17DRAFT_1549786 [Cyathus striatus]
MTIGDRGEGKYFGPSAGSETLFLAGAEIEQSPDEDLPVSQEIARFSACFPFGSDGNLETAYDLLFDHLPNQPWAWSLCETYMEHAA